MAALDSASPNVPVVRLAEQSVNHVLSFWKPDISEFIRDTRSAVPSSLGHASPTSTARCVQALSDFLYFSRIFPTDSSLVTRCIEVLHRFVSTHTEPTEFRRWLAAGANKRNDFTTCHTAIALAQLESISVQHELPQLAVSPEVLELVFSEAASTATEGSIPQFVAIAQARAVAAAKILLSGHFLEDPRYLSAKSSVEDFVNVRARFPAYSDEDELEAHVAAQLGFLGSQAYWRFDLMGLVIGTSLITALERESGNPLVKHVVSRLADLQQVDGTWSFARAVTVGGGRSLYVSSYEVSLTLALAALNADRLRLRERVERIDALLAVLIKTAQLAERSVRHIDGLNGETISGWANEQQQATVAESWTTSVVAQLLMRLAMVSDAGSSSTSLQALENLGCSVQDLPSRPVLGTWTDLDHSFGCRASKAFDFPSDPTKNAVLAKTIDVKVIEPAGRSWSNRPALPGKGIASLLIPGPPGSRKTSLVRAIATHLGWPLVVVVPSVFLQNGLEGFERQSDQLFRALLRLRRAVVFFDECEELIRRRSPIAGELGQRTIAAYTTPGMLPRLQELRDASWVIFAFATNAESASLDEAALRPGRFDAELSLLYPTRAARERYVSSKVGRMQLFGLRSGDSECWKLAKAVAKHISDDAQETDFGAPNGVPFSALDTVIEIGHTRWLDRTSNCSSAAPDVSRIHLIQEVIAELPRRSGLPHLLRGE